MKLLNANISKRNLVNVLLSVDVGWIHEPEGKRGISHFLEHALFLGNDTHPEPDEEAARYGVFINGKTMENRTVFYFVSLEENVETILELLFSLIFKPSFSEDKVLEERDSKIIPAVVKESDYYPWELAYEWARNLVFEWDFRYSMGTREELSKIGIGDLRDWHSRYYCQDNMSLVVSKYLEMEKLLKKFDYGVCKDRPKRHRVKHTDSEVVINKNIDNAEIVYAFPFSDYDMRSHILSVILGNYPTSLFWKAFHSEAYMVDATAEWYGAGGMFLYMGLNSKKVKKAHKKFESFISNISISEKDLEYAKKILVMDIQEKERRANSLEYLLKIDPELKMGGFAGILNEIENVCLADVSEYVNKVLNMDKCKAAIVL